MSDPELSKLNDSELFRQSVDPDNFPYISQRGMLYWTGSAWARWEGSTAISSIVPGTGATNLGKAEDAPHTTGDVGIMALGVRNDGGAASAANGDYIPLPVSEFSSIVGVPVHVVGDSDKYVRGNLAHDAIDSASDPVNIGGTAASAIPTAVAAGDRVRSYFDTYGQQHIIKQNDLVPSQYDYIGLTYTGSNLTGVVYKTGGAGGTAVATLALAYTGSQLDSVTKT